MRWPFIIGVLALGCAPGDRPVGDQPSIQAHLVVHVDPLSRGPSQGCEDDRLQRCGAVTFESWHRRTQNLYWLADTWIPAGRTVDVQLGPEAALAWAGHPETLAVLGQGAEETAEDGLCALGHLVGSGQASLGLHMHSVMPDTAQTWGELRVSAADDPCAATLDAPTLEVSAPNVESLVHYGASAVHPIATMLGSPIESFTAHVPRSMAAKIAAIDDPDGIDETVHRAFPDTFQPTTLGSAYAECYQQLTDHPPFEVYPADPVLPLAAGEGPMIIPGNRVVGSMAPHLGHETDGSVEAARRRLLQLMLNWRVAGLRGEEPRPWVFTFHAHLFDLEPGVPDPRDASGRLRAANKGNPFRNDVQALATTVDGYSAMSAWQGVWGDSGVMEWSLPRDLDDAGSRFGSEAGDIYLPLVTERLSDSHLVCNATRGAMEYFELERCPGGWAWGGDGFAQHCADGQRPQSVTVIVPDAGGCAPGSATMVQVGAVDGDRMGAAMTCSGGIWVPEVGLIIERLDGAQWDSELCPSL